MEFFVFLGGAFVVLVFVMWRSRRGTSQGPDALMRDLPNDQRDRNDGVGRPR